MWGPCLIQICGHISIYLFICLFFSEKWADVGSRAISSLTATPVLSELALDYKSSNTGLEAAARQASMTLGTTEFLLSLHKNGGISPLSFKILVCASPFSFLVFEQHALGRGYSPADHEFSPGTVGFHVKLGHGPALTAFL